LYLSRFKNSTYQYSTFSILCQVWQNKKEQDTLVLF